MKPENGKERSGVKGAGGVLSGVTPCPYCLIAKNDLRGAEYDESSTLTTSPTFRYRL